jgi:hypothetical protein
MALNALFRRAFDIKPERRNRAGEPQEPVKAGVPGPAGVPTLRLSRFLVSPNRTFRITCCSIEIALFSRLRPNLSNCAESHLQRRADFS